MEPNADSMAVQPPAVDVLHGRYGAQFGDSILEKWDNGGRQIFDAVPGGVVRVEAPAVDGVAEGEAGMGLDLEGLGRENQEMVES